MKKRLFMAVPVSDDIAAALRRFMQGHTDLNVRWTAPENLHITTYFLGDTDEKKIPALKESIQKVLAGFRPFELRWKETLFAPPRRPPRMIWVEFYGSPEFTLLVNRCYEASKPFTDPVTAEKPHPKPIPHITLARFNDPRVVEGVARRQLIPGEKNAGIASLHVEKVMLMASELKREGSTYTILETYALV